MVALAGLIVVPASATDRGTVDDVVLQDAGGGVHPPGGYPASGEKAGSVSFRLLGSSYPCRSVTGAGTFHSGSGSTPASYLGLISFNILTCAW
jgi:hypothetical protein